MRDHNTAMPADTPSNEAAGRNKTEERLNVIRGCMVGGAAGDALGYAVEFLDEPAIFARYGHHGIQSYELDASTGKALISDDTQMSLFTANAILYGDTRECLLGRDGQPSLYIRAAYQDWYKTQTMPFNAVQLQKRGRHHKISTWLTDVPELYHHRAPGNTCITALEQISNYKEVHNNSKGCGGLMRIAPLGLFYESVDIKWLDAEGAALAAVTHQHPLGFMPAAMMTHIINRITTSRGADTLKEIVSEASRAMAEMYRGEPFIEDMLQIVDKAVSLSENTETDLNNIHGLGEGWVAEETLAIAIYCALRHHDDFSAGVIAAANHLGDSDSTGAVAGNLLGAWLGYKAMDEKWKKDLELLDVILEISDDLCCGCQRNECSRYWDENWTRKYVRARWKAKKPSPVPF